MALDLVQASSRRSLGLAHNATSFHEDLRLTLLELDRLVEAGRLVRTHREKLEMEFRFDALEDWREFVNRPHAGHVDADIAQLDDAEAALVRGESAIIATESQIVIALSRIT